MTKGLHTLTSALRMGTVFLLSFSLGFGSALTLVAVRRALGPEPLMLELPISDLQNSHACVGKDTCLLTEGTLCGLLGPKTE